MAESHRGMQIVNKSAAAPTSLRPLLSSHKAAMLPSLASSRKLDIRGPPPKSCAWEKGGKGSGLMRDTVIASLLSVPLPLSPRPNFLP